jgi:hypothetical protein
MLKYRGFGRVVHGAAAGGEAAFGCDALRVNRLMCRRSTLHFLRGNVTFVDSGRASRRMPISSKRDFSGLMIASIEAVGPLFHVTPAHAVRRCTLLPHWPEEAITLQIDDSFYGFLYRGSGDGSLRRLMLMPFH